VSDQQLISEVIGKCIAYANGANIINKNSAIPPDCTHEKMGCT